MLRPLQRRGDRQRPVALQRADQDFGDHAVAVDRDRLAVGAAVGGGAPEDALLLEQRHDRLDVGLLAGMDRAQVGERRRPLERGDDRSEDAVARLVPDHARVGRARAAPDEDLVVAVGDRVDRRITDQDVGLLDRVLELGLHAGEHLQPVAEWSRIGPCGGPEPSTHAEIRPAPTRARSWGLLAVWW
jgi:hypothetical protein